MIDKVFISHSSAQKDIAVLLRNAIGADNCFMDQFDFEAAYKTLDEICNKLGKTTVFVLLISKEALRSDWVDKEIKKAREYVSNGKITLFCAYIVDDTMLEEIPEWMSKDECYNLKKFPHVMLLAQDVKRKLLRIRIEKDPVYKFKQEVFVGRNDKLNEFESKYYSSEGFRKISMIVSGRKGVGRTRFVNRCLSTVMNIEPTIPFMIEIDSKGGIEDFIIQLNNATGQYDSIGLQELLSGNKDDKIEGAICLIKNVYNYQGYIFIQDNKGVVRPERKLAEWFQDLILHRDFPQELKLFVISSFNLNIYAERNIPQIIHINLPPLSRIDCKKLFYHTCQKLCIDDIDDKQSDDIINRLVSSPGLITESVFAIKIHGYLLAKNDIEELVKETRGNMAPIAEELFKQEDMTDLIILLSRTEYLSIEILEEIFNDRLDQFNVNVISLLARSLVSAFGPGDRYIKLDDTLADYIRRSKRSLSPDLLTWVNEVISKRLEKDGRLDGDLSVYLYNIRERLRRGEIELETIMLPSMAIRTIIELYDSKQWDAVITMCDSLLNNSYNLSYYTEVIKEIKYWLCQALCKKVDKRFFQEYKYFHGHDMEFLLGFYYRHEGHPDTAEKHFRKALEITPTLSRAKRELVGVLLAQRKYPDALELAHENYLTYRGNPYHIDAYYRCLIRKLPQTRDDMNTLSALYQEMKSLTHPKRDSFLRAMQLEYHLRMDKRPVVELLKEVKEALQEFPDSIEVNRAVNDIEASKAISKRRDFIETPDEY